MSIYDIIMDRLDFDKHSCPLCKQKIDDKTYLSILKSLMNMNDKRFRELEREIRR